MSSFDSELAALVREWLGRGETPDGILRALVYAIAKNGPAEKSVPDIVGDVLAAESEAA